MMNTKATATTTTKLQCQKLNLFFYDINQKHLVYPLLLFAKYTPHDDDDDDDDYDDKKGKGKI